MNLSKNFTYDELTYSATAERLKIDNTPTKEILDKLKRLCNEVLQPIRDKYGKPIIVTSGYRSLAVNKAVGGAKSSQHMKGEAADLKVLNMNEMGKLYKLIQNMVNEKTLTVGQCIWEYGDNKNPKWIHVSLPTSKHKNEFFKIS